MSANIYDTLDDLMQIVSDLRTMMPRPAAAAVEQQQTMADDRALADAQGEEQVGGRRKPPAKPRKPASAKKPAARKPAARRTSYY